MKRKQMSCVEMKVEPFNVRNKQVKWPIDTADEKISEFNGRPEKVTFSHREGRLMGRAEG